MDCDPACNASSAGHQYKWIPGGGYLGLQFQRPQGLTCQFYYLPTSMTELECGLGQTLFSCASFDSRVSIF